VGLHDLPQGGEGQDDHHSQTFSDSPLVDYSTFLSLLLLLLLLVVVVVVVVVSVERSSVTCWELLAVLPQANSSPSLNDCGYSTSTSFHSLLTESKDALVASR
jgi:hypothetical protein